MEYIFYGFYWVFCLIRAVLTDSFGSVQFGKFHNWDNLFMGFFGVMLWLIPFALIVGLAVGLMGKSENEPQL